MAVTDVIWSRWKIGANEFEAEGPHELVAAHLATWQEGQHGPRRSPRVGKQVSTSSLHVVPQFGKSHAHPPFALNLSKGRRNQEFMLRQAQHERDRSGTDLPRLTRSPLTAWMAGVNFAPCP